MTKRVSSDVLTEAISILETAGANTAEAKASISHNVGLMRTGIQEDKRGPSPHSVRDDLIRLAKAADTLAKAKQPAAGLVQQWFNAHKIAFSPAQRAELSTYLASNAQRIVLPKGAQRPKGPSPRAKGYAVLATANVIRQCCLGCSPLRYNELVEAFGINRYTRLAEAMYELISGEATGAVGKLRRQIDEYRADKLNLDHGLNVVIKGK